MTDDQRAVRLYRLLLGLYPRWFRDEYGADMVQLVRDQCADEPAWRVYSRVVVDLALTIPTQQMEARMNRSSTHVVPLIYTAVAVAGLLLAIGGGTNPTMLVGGVALAVITGAAAFVAWGRAAPIGPRMSTDGWWKLVALGPCIVAVVIVAAGLGVEAWFVGIFAVLVAFAVTIVGVLLGLLRLTDRNTPHLPT